jgi:hypothetical protein
MSFRAIDPWARRSSWKNAQPRTIGALVRVLKDWCPLSLV